MKLHHESIYRYLLKNKASGGLLYKHLRHQGKPYRKRYGHPNNRTGIPNRIDIDQRSDAVNNREVFGHWEADTIIGKTHKGVIVTLDERISKLRLAYPLNSKHKDGVSAAISTLLRPVKGFVYSITYDNGKEFSGHEQVNKSINCKSYFAKPYHSWERGQNENANGLLRQYFPKTMSLVNVACNEVKIA
ncbi:Mobile element protein, partial [uncultured Gammaproteobacteria bacterium]